MFLGKSWTHFDLKIPRNWSEASKEKERRKKKLFYFIFNLLGGRGTMGRKEKKCAHEGRMKVTITYKFSN